MVRTLEQQLACVDEARTIRCTGRVVQTVGLVIESEGPRASVGELCRIEGAQPGTWAWAEVVGFRGTRTLLMPLMETRNVAPGSTVVATGAPLQVGVGSELLGRVLDGLGHPIDGRGPLHTDASRPLVSTPPNPMTRQRISEPLVTGVRSIDALASCGRGQRLGIFAGSGVGKSILLGMMARNCDADVNVVALIGERSREVREFVERDLGEDGLRRSVVVAATSAQPAVARLKCAQLAATVAEYFRDRGQHVMLVMDSLTRVAMAQREVGLAAGEPPATRGYPPSAFALLPRLLERAGTATRGSITGIYTVLVEADDMNDPIADAARSILDGHLVLSRRLATEGLYPAVDVLESVSRVMREVVDDSHREAAAKVREWMAIYRKNEDLITVGAYQKGRNARVDAAVDKYEPIRAFLRQGQEESCAFADTVAQLRALAEVSPS